MIIFNTDKNIVANLTVHQKCLILRVDGKNKLYDFENYQKLIDELIFLDVDVKNVLEHIRANSKEVDLIVNKQISDSNKKNKKRIDPNQVSLF